MYRVKFIQNGNVEFMISHCISFLVCIFGFQYLRKLFGWLMLRCRFSIAGKNELLHIILL